MNNKSYAQPTKCFLNKVKEWNKSSFGHKL